MKKRLFMLIMVLALLLSITMISSMPKSALATTESDTEIEVMFAGNPTTTSLRSALCISSINSPTINMQMCGYSTDFQLSYFYTNGTHYYYQIFDDTYKLCLGVANNSTADGAAIVEKTCNPYGDQSQSWDVQVGSGTLVLNSTISNGKCIKYDPNTRAVIQTSSGGCTLGWYLIPSGTTSYGGGHIKSDYSGKCLDIDNSSGGYVDGTKVQQWDCLGFNDNQLFSIDPIDYTNPSGGINPYPRYYIYNPGTGKCVVPTGWSNGNPYLLYPCSGSNVYLYIFPLYTNGGIKYRIEPWAHTALCMDMDTANGNVNGAKIQTWTCNGWSNQSWIFKQTTAS